MSSSSTEKDNWDRVAAIAQILVPAAIALAGHFIAQGLKQAEIASENQRADQARVLAEANTKIAQAELINTLMKSLTSANPQERKLAVEAVLIGLPGQGAALVRAMAQSDEDKTVQAVAKASLEQRTDMLIRDLFSDEASARINAARVLSREGRTDPTIVPELVEFSQRNSQNANGVYNAVVVLNELPTSALKARESDVVKLIDLAKATGPKTSSQAAELTKRLGR